MEDGEAFLTGTEGTNLDIDAEENREWLSTDSSSSKENDMPAEDA